MKFAMPKLITTRPSTGQKEFMGMTPMEWVLTFAYILGLYVILAAFFAALLIIAQTIRNSSKIVRTPSHFLPYASLPVPVYVS